jgi:hypothetical protein
MSMNKVGWAVFLNKLQKHPEAPMAGIFRVFDKSWRGMADNQIDAAAAPEGETHFPDKPGHLLFGILINIAVIPSRTGKTDYPDTTDFHNLPVNMKASLWRRFFISEIVIAENIQQRRIIAMFQGGEIFGRQIAAGKDQVNAGNSRTAADRLKQAFDDGIGDTENFHKEG